MKENYNIKVSAEYEVPKNDKLDTLMAEYYAAKNAYEETEQQIVPLINASGKAKFDAIIDQLEVVVDHMKQYALITGKSPIQYSVSYNNNSNCNKFTILYWQSDGQIKMYFNGCYDNLQRREFVWHNEYNANPISSNNHQALDDKMLDIIEKDYFNEGSEWIVHDEDEEPESPENINGTSMYCFEWGEDDIKQEIANAFDCSRDEVVLYKFTGYSRIPNYEIV